MECTKLKGVDVVKEIRNQIKKEFSGFKFSITQESYSGGWSIHISLLESPIKIVKDFEEIPKETLQNWLVRDYSMDQLRALQTKGYYQLNEYILREAYDPEGWCNGVFLTEEGHKLLQRVVQISDKYNWNHSDSQSDYYDVNFHLDLAIGKWDRKFIQEVRE